MDAHTHPDIYRTNCNVQTHAMSTGGHGDESSACFLNMDMGVGGGIRERGWKHWVESVLACLHYHEDWWPGCQVEARIRPIPAKYYLRCFLVCWQTALTEFTTVSTRSCAVAESICRWWVLLLYLVCSPTLNKWLQYNSLNLTGTEIYGKSQIKAPSKYESSTLKLAFVIIYFNASLWSRKCLTYFRAFRAWVPGKRSETGRDWSDIQREEHKLPKTEKCAKGKSLSTS